MEGHHQHQRFYSLQNVQLSYPDGKSDSHHGEVAYKTTSTERPEHSGDSALLSSNLDSSHDAPPHNKQIQQETSPQTARPQLSRRTSIAESERSHNSVRSFLPRRSSSLREPNVRVLLRSMRLQLTNKNRPTLNPSGLRDLFLLAIRTRASQSS